MHRRGLYILEGKIHKDNIIMQKKVGKDMNSTILMEGLGLINTSMYGVASLCWVCTNSVGADCMHEGTGKLVESGINFSTLALSGLLSA